MDSSLPETTPPNIFVGCQRRPTASSIAQLVPRRGLRKAPLLPALTPSESQEAASTSPHRPGLHLLVLYQYVQVVPTQALVQGRRRLARRICYGGSGLRLWDHLPGPRSLDVGLLRGVWQGAQAGGPCDICGSLTRIRQVRSLQPQGGGGGHDLPIPRMWVYPYRSRQVGGDRRGCWAAFTFAEFPVARLSSLHEAVTRAVAPKQSCAASTPRGHVG